VYGSSTLLDMAPATWVAGDMPLEGVVKFTHAKLDKSETEESPGGEGDEDEKPPGSPVDKQAQSLKAQKEAELMAFMRETTTSFLRKLMLGPPASEVKFYWDALEFLPVEDHAYAIELAKARRETEAEGTVKLAKSPKS